MQYGHIEHEQAKECGPHGHKAKTLGKLVAQFGDDLAGVQMYQHKTRRKGSFAVVYYREFHAGLTYAQAAEKFGQAVMHYQSCNASIDNERD